MTEKEAVLLAWMEGELDYHRLAVRSYKAARTADAIHGQVFHEGQIIRLKGQISRLHMWSDRFGT